MRFRAPLGFLLLAGLLVAPSHEPVAVNLPETVRVRLFAIEQPSEIRVTTDDGQHILIHARKTQAAFRSNGPVTIERPPAGGVHLQYPIEVDAAGRGLRIVADVPFEEYVAAVLAGEASNFRSDESLRAMAIAVRTYAAHFMARHQSEGFNFCDTTHCQDFRISGVNERFRKASTDTRGQVLLYDGQPIAAYYHQDCGGTTEAQAPYLPQLKDPFCVSNGGLRWTAGLTASDVRAAVRLNQVSAIEVVERSPSGRVQRLRLSGTEVRVMRAEAFRLAVGRTLGWNRIRSDLYEVHRSGDRFLFDGRGAGHGIGMCQDGAAVMGEEGFSYQEILGHYYPNTHLSRLN
jgi:stage II sporulation protein D (peptidoglycan lytic transglycosylase)